MADSIIKVPQLSPDRAASEIDNRVVVNLQGTGGHANRQVVALGGDTGDDLVTPLSLPPVGTERAIPVRQVGIASVSLRPSNCSAIRSVILAAQADILLFAANTNRIGGLVYNDSNSSVLIGFGPDPVSQASFSYLISAATLFELPTGFESMEVRGFWLEAEGKAHLTELVLI